MPELTDARVQVRPTGFRYRRPMLNFNVPAVPTWVTSIAAFLAIFGTGLGLLSLIAPGDDADDAVLERVFGGYGLGIAVAFAVALWLASIDGLLVAFVAGIFRFGGDLVGGIVRDPTSWTRIVIASIFLTICVAAMGALVAVRPGGLRRTTAPEAPSPLL